MVGNPEVDVHKKLSDYGVDSSIVVKICNMLTLRAGTEVSIFNITKSATYFATLRIGCGKEQSSQSIAASVFCSMLLENAYIYHSDYSNVDIRYPRAPMAPIIRVSH